MGGGYLNKRGCSVDNVNINNWRGARVQIKGWGVLKMVSVRSGNPSPLIMGIALAKSWSTRGSSRQPAFMSDCRTISHRYFLSHVFTSFVFLMFSVITLKKKEMKKLTF